MRNVVDIYLPGSASAWSAELELKPHVPQEFEGLEAFLFSENPFGVGGDESYVEGRRENTRKKGCKGNEN